MKRLLLIVLPLFISLGFSQQLFTVVDTDEGNNVKITYYKETQNKLEKVKYKEYYPNGQKSSEGTYKDGKGDGLVTQWRENGKKGYEGTYKDGKLDGLTTVWYENGEKKFEGTYEGSIKNDKWTWWYPNGQKKTEGKYIYYIQTSGNTVVRQKKKTFDFGSNYWYNMGFSPQGDISGSVYPIHESTYKDGKQDGLWTMWYENGQKRWEGTYKGGKLDGLVTIWWENGQKMDEINGIVDGERNGKSTSWYENGQKKSEGNYTNKPSFNFIQADGLWTMWYENGQKKKERTYKDRMINYDKDKCWNEDGNEKDCN